MAAPNMARLSTARASAMAIYTVIDRRSALDPLNPNGLKLDGKQAPQFTVSLLRSLFTSLRVALLLCRVRCGSPTCSSRTRRAAKSQSSKAVSFLLAWNSSHRPKVSTWRFLLARASPLSVNLAVSASAHTLVLTLLCLCVAKVASRQ